MERSLLISLEMISLDVMLICILRSINFEDTNLAVVTQLLHRIDADYAWFLFYRYCSHVVGKLQILLQVFRIDLYFTDSYYHCTICLCLLLSHTYYRA